MFGIDTHFLQGKAVGYQHMAGDMHRHHRVVCGDRIQLGAGGVTVLHQQRVVVAETRHPLTSGSCGRLFPQRREHLVHGGECADRRAVQVGCNHLQAGTWEMPVGIDKARH